MIREQAPSLLESARSSGSDPAECLRRTFPDDEARRPYFLDRLREQRLDLPSRQIEGLPVGEVDEILAFPDPPYFTACPTPFLMAAINRNGDRILGSRYDWLSIEKGQDDVH